MEISAYLIVILFIRVATQALGMAPRYKSGDMRCSDCAQIEHAFIHTMAILHNLAILSDKCRLYGDPIFCMVDKFSDIRLQEYTCKRAILISK